MSYSTTSIPTALLLAMALSACGESGGSGLTSPSFATRIEHNNVRLPFFLADVDNPCTPEIEAIDLEGTIHGQGSFWDNDHFKSHYNVTLTGSDANGTRYLSTSTGNGMAEIPDSETEDVVISTLLVSQDGTDNFVVKLVLHFAADGTVRVDRAGEECRG